METLPHWRKLSSHNLPWPADWPSLFGTERPLILEIGFGYGHFLLHLARTHPDHNVIGLEINNRCLNKVENIIMRDAIDNVRVIHAAAETALACLFQPTTIAQVHINFPDPWFKTRHGHRRLMQRDTLDLLVNRLAAGGTLYLATDILEYALMSHELLSATPGLENLLPTPWADAMPGRVPTKYEQKARREGRSCYYFAYRRGDSPAPAVPPAKELIMPHIVFTSPLLFDAVRQQFAPVTHHEGDTHINFIQVYGADDALLFDTYVKESLIDQRIALVLLRHPDEPNTYTLQLSPIGHPRPTPGLHTAVGLLGRWLLSLHPQAQIIKHTLQSEQAALLPG